MEVFTLITQVSSRSDHSDACTGHMQIQLILGNGKKMKKKGFLYKFYYNTHTFLSPDRHYYWNTTRQYTDASNDVLNHSIHVLPIWQPCFSPSTSFLTPVLIRLSALGTYMCLDLRPYSVWTGEAQYFACQNIGVG